MSTYLIVGGTGKVGGRLAQILQNGGHTARVASRTGGDVRFDWRDPATWGPALDGADGVFLVGPGSATDWSDTLAALLSAADGAGVRRAVFLSARGVEFLPGGAVDKAERALMAGPLHWTILRPTHFAQNFTEAMFVPQDDVIIAPVAGGAEPFIDIEDLAEVAAAALTNDAWADKVIEVSGPAAITFDEAAAVLSARTARPVRFQDEEPQLHAARLREAQTPEGYIAWRIAMLEGIRRGDDAYLSDGVQRVLGRPATSFADWAAREVHQ